MTCTPDKWSLGPHNGREGVSLVPIFADDISRNGGFVIARFYGPDQLDNARHVLACIDMAAKASKMTGEEARALCDNCGKEHDIMDLASFVDFWSRFTPGSESPVGDCPSCGAFCYVVVGS